MRRAVIAGARRHPYDFPVLSHLSLDILRHYGKNSTRRTLKTCEQWAVNSEEWRENESCVSAPPHRGALRPTRSFHIHKFHKTASGAGRWAYLSLSVRIEALLTLWNEYLKHAEANMPEKNPNNQEEAFLGADVEANLRRLSTPCRTECHLSFHEGGRKRRTQQRGKDLLRTFNRISSKIELREFDLDTPEAKKRYVTSSPTLLFDPENYMLRYSGCPTGRREDAGRGDSAARLSDGQFEPASEKILRRIDSKREVKVFVSPPVPTVRTRPKCGKGVVERPDIVSSK